MKNYWKMDDLSILTVPYAYVDHSSYLADSLFSKGSVALKYKGEMLRKDSPYRIVFCRVWKKDTQKFEKAMGNLENKMLLMGHRDYPEFCETIEKLIEEHGSGKRGRM